MTHPYVTGVDVFVKRRIDKARRFEAYVKSVHGDLRDMGQDEWKEFFHTWEKLERMARK